MYFNGKGPDPNHRHKIRPPFYRDVERNMMLLKPGLQRDRLTQESDLYIAVCQVTATWHVSTGLRPSVVSRGDALQGGAGRDRWAS